MIRRRTLLVKVLFFATISVVFAVFLIFLSPRYSFLGRLVSARDMALLITNYESFPEFTLRDKFFLASFIFMIFALTASGISEYISSQIKKNVYLQTETALFNNFIERLRFCYRHEELVAAIQEELEYQADCAVLLANTKTEHVIYNSTSAFISDPETYDLMRRRFSTDWTWYWAEGLYFFDTNMQLVGDKRKARGLFIASGDIRFFLICRFIRNTEPEIFPILLHEFNDYLNREKTLGQLLYYSQLSQEWSMVANTQRSFLPKKLPDTTSIEVGAYFQPLVHVSGDYYDIIKIDEDKTLLVTGDVSGKGLAAALVMGIVMNTIQIIENKEDLAGIIYAIDTAIKRMKLQDKYTVLFLGLIDTKKMTIKYVNASMEKPFILTESRPTFKVKTLESNCSVVGIIDLDEVIVEERPLYHGDVILMLSDGIPETMDANGIELGETDYYLDSIKEFAHNPPAEMVKNIADMALSFSANNAMRDDVTIVAVKLKR
ncbi:SpoIIE family protein phosphatase [Treponema phagedenis]|uniref:PP2C family protein-serine/threonine phosphatase n=1 Tax=Treponema phagedenis TaxID=162 RepID=UPI000586796F|nr:SpoIIE family protein phosphatase [Treponema phagedenis]